MQLALVESGRQVAQRTAAPTTAVARTAAPERIAEPSRQAAKADPVAPMRGGPMRGGLRGIDPDFNRQVAGTQQALEFLDRSGAELQGLKVALSARLAATQISFANEGADASALEQQIRRFADLWRQRPTATAGTLDDQLGYNASGQARRKFSVRGLQMSSLRAGDRETLSFAVGGSAQRAASVVIEPGLSEAALVQRFDRALAPGGIRTIRDAQGELGFSVPESAWSTVRDTLAIKGEGRRFPTGQFSQLRLVPEQPAIRPQDWSAGDTASLRRTLQHVVAAQDAVRDTRQSVNRALADAGSRLQPQTAEGEAKAQADAQWSATFAQTFEATAGRGDYRALSAVTPALSGVNRDRVTALLRLTD